MAKCAENRVLNNLEAIKNNTAVVLEIESYVDSLLGINEELKSYKNYKNLKQLMMDSLAKVYLVQGNVNFDPELWSDSIREYLSHKLGYFQDGMITRGKSTVDTVYKLLDNLFKAQEKSIEARAKKDKGSFGFRLRQIFDRAWLPPHLFALKQDITGKFLKFIEKTEHFINSVSSYKTDHEIRLTDIHSKFQKYIESLVEGIGDLSKIDSSYYLDGIDVRIIHKGSEKVVKWVGFKDGYHRVKGLDAENPDKISFIEEHKITKNDIVNALSEKYLGEFTDKLINGQIRYIKWVDEPNQEDLKEIDNVFRILKTLKDNGEVAVHPQIQSIKINGAKYSYILIEDKSTTNYSGYKAFLISKEIKDKKEYYFYYDKNGNLKSKLLSYRNKLGLASSLNLKSGYYEAQEHKEFGKYVRVKKGKYYIQDWYVADFSNFKLMKIQPNSAILAKKVSGISEFYSLGNVVNEKNKLNKKIAEEIELFAKLNQDKLNELFGMENNNQTKFYNLLVKKFGKKGLNLYLEIEELLNTQLDFYVDEKTKEIVSKNIYFKRKKKNYYPRMYDNETIDRMLSEYIQELKSELEKAVLDNNTEKTKMLNELINNLETSLISRYDPNMRRKNPVERKNIHTKHRRMWIDPMQRRMDSNVMFDYINDVYIGIAKTDLMLSLFDWMSSYIKSSESDDFSLIKYAIRRTKMALHDPTYDIDLPFVKWLSNKRLAEIFRKVGINASEDKVERMILHIKANIAGAVLGPSTALSNTMQLMNTIVNLGLDRLREANKLMLEPEWQEALQRAQITAITRYFEHLLHGKGGNITLRDIGWIKLPTIGMSIPLKNWGRYIKFILASREKFIKEGIPEVDKYLTELERNRIEQLKDNLENINELEVMLLEALNKHPDKLAVSKIKSLLKSLRREQALLKEEDKKRNIEEIRKAFADLMLGINRNNKTLIEKKIQALMGNLSRQKLGRMVAVSIGYVPMQRSLLKGIERFLTMTKSEEYMRSVTAIAYAKQLIDSGIVEVKPGESIKNNPEILKAMNRGVINTMFALNPSGLGEAMSGAMGIVNMFKGYTVNQMLVDFSILQGITNQGWHLAPYRLSRALWQLRLMKIGGYKYSPTMKNVKYKGKVYDVDHEAIRALRFLLWRTIPTVLMSTMRIAGKLNPVLKMISLDRSTMFAFIRGSESPLIGAPLRLIMSAIVAAMLTNNHGNDDDWKQVGEWAAIWFAMSFLPFVLTFPLVSMYYFGKKVQ